MYVIATQGADCDMTEVDPYTPPESLAKMKWPIALFPKLSFVLFLVTSAVFSFFQTTDAWCFLQAVEPVFCERIDGWGVVWTFALLLCFVVLLASIIALVARLFTQKPLALLFCQWLQIMCLGFGGVLLLDITWQAWSWMV